MSFAIRSSFAEVEQQEPESESKKLADAINKLKQSISTNENVTKQSNNPKSQPVSYSIKSSDSAQEDYY